MKIKPMIIRFLRIVRIGAGILGILAAIYCGYCLLVLAYVKDSYPDVDLLMIPAAKNFIVAFPYIFLMFFLPEDKK